ncbi:MAG TPA: outer membrane protein assembly factor BamD [Kofleriaceae bacterium]
MRLDDGDARIHVDHRGVWRRLVVLVPDGELDDVGTTFLVRVRDGHTFEVAVEDGRVTFLRGHDAPLLLTAGERWVVHEPVAAVAPVPSAAPAPPRAPSTPSIRVHAAAGATGAARAPIGDELRDAISDLDAGDPTTASRKLREIVERYPSDPRAEDAAYLLAIALQRASDTIGARAAARDYLQRFPNGFRRAAIEPLAR